MQLNLNDLQFDSDIINFENLEVIISFFYYMNINE
jgi:hypothetical protein